MQTMLKGNGKVIQGKQPLSPGLGKPTEKAESVGNMRRPDRAGSGPLKRTDAGLQHQCWELQLGCEKES